jgi:hypothetical protein
MIGLVGTNVESYKENCKFVLCTALVISRGLGKRFPVILLLIRGVEPVLKAIRKIVSWTILIFGLHQKHKINAKFDSNAQYRWELRRLQKITRHDDNGNRVMKITQ